jgi:transcriptional regulator with XRE-family HTH domain
MAPGDTSTARANSIGRPPKTAIAWSLVMPHLLAYSKNNGKTLKEQIFKLTCMYTLTLSDRAAIILAKLEAQGISASDLAKRIGVSPATITLWKNGITNSIKAPHALRIQQEFGYSIEWLVFGTEPKMLEDVQKEVANRLIAQKISQGELMDISRLSPIAKRALAHTAQAFLTDTIGTSL